MKQLYFQNDLTVNSWIWPIFSRNEILIYVPFNRLLTLGVVAWYLQKGEQIPEIKPYNTWLAARAFTTRPSHRPMTRASSDAMLRGVYGSPNKARFWQMMAYKLINGDLGFKWLEATKAGQVRASYWNTRNWYSKFRHIQQKEVKCPHFQELPIEESLQLAKAIRLADEVGFDGETLAEEGGQLLDDLAENGAQE